MRWDYKDPEAKTFVSRYLKKKYMAARPTKAIARATRDAR
jgi:hypothetical protein